MLVTIEYKFVLVFIGLALALFGQPLVQTLPPEAQFYLYLGLGLNVFCVVFYEFSCLFTKYGKFISSQRDFLLLQRLHIMRDKNNRMQRLQNSMETYRKASVFLKANKLVIFNTTMITFVQRILLFAVIICCI